MDDHKRCVHQKPIIDCLANFLYFRGLRKPANKIAALMVPILIANLVLSIIPFGATTRSVAQASGEPQPTCRMELTKTSSPDPVLPGNDLQYHLRLASVGTGICTGGGVKLEEHYDPQTTFGSATPTPVQSNNLWNFGELAPGAVREVDITARVSVAAHDGDILTNAADRLLLCFC